MSETAAFARPISPPQEEPNAGQRIFALGFQVLFLELVLIRFLAAHIWNLGYFPNLVLMAAFIGFGFGFILHRHIAERTSKLLYLAMPPVLLAFVLLVFFLKPHALVGYEMGDLNFKLGGEMFLSGNPDPATLGEQLSKFLVWFCGIVGIFLLIGQRMAKLFRLLPPLRAYSHDIAGSLAGIALFILISFLLVPATYWFIVFALSFVVAAGSDARPIPKCFLALAPLALAVISHFMDNPVGAKPIIGWEDNEAPVAHAEGVKRVEDIVHHSLWTPYQRLTLTDDQDHAASVWILSNGVRYQFFGPASRDQYSYFLTHDLRRQQGGEQFEDVLIIGAGSGNDVMAALLNGAQRIDAVDIDPGIIPFGEYASARYPAPYLDGRVRTTVDDGRNHLYSSDRKYDLIVFALTDSLVKVSSVAQLRLENYLFTVNSFRKASELLEPGGWLVLYNYYRQPWLVDKLKLMMSQGMPHGTTFSSTRIPYVGSGVDPLHFILVGMSPYDGNNTYPEITDAGMPGIDPATDDWPFPYMKERGVPFHYQFAMAFVIGLVLVSLFAFGRSSQRSDPRFAVAFTLLGSAFLLLETKGVIQFSLLFGTTWLNNSLVFFAVLVSVLLGIRVAQAVRGSWLLPTASVLLLASAAVQFAVPLGSLLAFDPLPRFLLAGALMFTPVFMANLIFSVLFRDRADAELYFGWNLLGATAGGVLEYLSLATGYQALGAVVIALYAVALGAAWLGIRNQVKREETTPMPHAGDGSGMAAPPIEAPAESGREWTARANPEVGQEGIQTHE